MPETKDTNPKDAVGIKKAPLSTVPGPVIMEIGLAMLEGARKYGRHNYRISGVRASVYYDAAMRHLMAYWEGEDTDPDSGLPHIVKAMACLAVLRDAELNQKLTDDRPPRCPKNWMGELNKKAAAIVEKYPDPKDPYLETDPKPELACDPNQLTLDELLKKAKPHQVVIIPKGDKPSDYMPGGRKYAETVTKEPRPVQHVACACDICKEFKP